MGQISGRTEGPRAGRVVCTVVLTYRILVRTLCPPHGVTLALKKHIHHHDNSGTASKRCDKNYVYITSKEVGSD